MHIVSLQNANAGYYAFNQLKWTSGPVKILGIEVSNEFEKMSIDNYV